VAEQGVDARGVDRHPAHGLRRIAYRAHRPRPAACRSRRGRRRRRTPTARARTRRGRVGRDRVGQARQRSGADADAAAGVHEGQDERRELVFGHEHRRPRQRRREKRHLHRRLRADRDALGATPTSDAKCARDASTARLYSRDVGASARSAVTARRVAPSAARRARGEVAVGGAELGTQRGEGSAAARAVTSLQRVATYASTAGIG
jgi:hypothetical protein